MKGVKGETETEYRKGFVNITLENIGVYSKTEVNNLINKLTDDMQQKFDDLSDKITEINISIPDAITDLTASNITKDSITLLYTIPKNADSVIVYYSSETSNVDSSNYENSIIINQNSCVINGLIPNNSYCFAVYSKNKNSISEKSNIITATTEKDRVYLYNYGNECVDITGGWECILPDVFKKMTDYMEIDSSRYIGGRMDADVHTVNNSMYETLLTILNDERYSKYELYMEYKIDTNSPFGSYSNHDRIISVLINQTDIILTSDFEHMQNNPFENEKEKNVIKSNLVCKDYLIDKFSYGYDGNIEIRTMCDEQYYFRLKIYAIYLE